MEVEKHVKPLGFGRYHVIEGVKLNKKPLSRAQAEALANRETTIDAVEAMMTKKSELEALGEKLDAAAQSFRAAFDEWHSELQRRRGAGCLGPTMEMARLQIDRVMSNHMRGTVLRSPYGGPTPNRSLTFTTISVAWHQMIAAREDMPRVS
jgi:hypothetical protein